jgi:hypothetical protein
MSLLIDADVRTSDFILLKVIQHEKFKDVLFLINELLSFL